MSAMLLLRHWRTGVMGLLLLACGFLWLAKAAETRRAEKWEARARGEIAAHKGTVENYRRAAEEARKADAENKARVEREQDRVSKETLSDYQNRLADLRRRYDALRLRPGAPQANPGSPGTEAVPGVPCAAERADDPACQDGLPPEDALIASEISLRLEALQAWVRKQVKIDR